VKLFNRLLITGFLITLWTGTAALAAMQVAAQVDTSRPIYADSPFSYSIVVVNGSKPETVDLSPLKNFNPSNPYEQTRSTNINGQQTNYNILTYELIAPGPGEHVLPAVDVTVGGKLYKTNPVAFTVVEPGTTKQIDVDVELSASSCYVGQPVVLTFSFFVWTDIARREAISNISFRVPVLENDSFYVEDVDDTVPTQRLAEIPVNGQRQSVLQDQLSHQGVDCVRVRFSKVLIPRTPGEFSLEAASASADLAVAQSAPASRSMFDSFFGSRYEYKRFNARSRALELKVLPVPDAGKPADFYGLVGNYTISATAAPVQVSVGDPITLTIRIGGSRYLKPIQWPTLETIEGFSDFKIPSERADGEIQSGQKVFTQTVRAGSDRVRQIPPIPLSFFDAEKGTYQTIYSNPIPLEVSPTRTVTGADIERNTQFTSARRQMESIKEGLSANYTSADALIPQQFHIGSAVTGLLFWLLWAGPAAVLVLSLFGRMLTLQNPKRAAARRRKTACSTAVRRLRKLPLQSHAAGSEVSRILKQYMADKFNKVSGALTAEDVYRLIADAVSDGTIAERFKQLIERTEAAAYSPAAFDFNADTQHEIIAILREVEKKIK
jgi:hypothetical protein